MTDTRTALDKTREALDAAIEAGHSNSNNSLEDMLRLVDDAREALSALSAIEAEAVGGLYGEYTPTSVRADTATPPDPVAEAVEDPRVKVPEGQTPLNNDLGHRLLDVFAEGKLARENDTRSPYHGHSLEHCIHAAGWVQQDLRMALDEALTRHKGGDDA